MILRSVAGPGARILDVGGGDSTLVDDLVHGGFGDVTVLDIAPGALERARQRLGSGGMNVRWIESDVLQAQLPERQFDVWHDRALFHFLIDAEARLQYISKAAVAVKSGGHLILATFASDGPERCSGLPTMRYSPEELAREAREYFAPVETQREIHTTPEGTDQSFIYCRFRHM
jgi:ubiquinone/menaquinone biosynthesis C-methylase UbiE